MVEAEQVRRSKNKPVQNKSMEYEKEQKGKYYEQNEKSQAFRIGQKI